MTAVLNAPEASSGRRQAKPPRPRRVVRTPFVAQMEEQDCAAACLSAVLGALGRHVPLHEARDACGVSRDGATAASIVRAAQRYGVQAEGRRVPGTRPDGTVDLAPLAAVQAPAVLLVDGPHFVVLEGVRRGRIRLNDPTVGRGTREAGEFLESYRGVALTFDVGPDFVPARRRLPFLRDVAARLRPYGLPLCVGVATAVLVSLPTLATALLLRLFLTGRVLGDSWGGTICLVMLACSLGVFAGSWLQQRVLARVLVAMSVRTSVELLWRLLRLPGAFFHRRQLGGLVTRVQVNDGLAVLLTTKVAATVAGLAGAVVYGAALVRLDPLLSLVVLAVAVADVVVLRLVTVRRAAGEHRLQVEEYRRDGIAFAGVAAIETLKAEGGEDGFFARWAGWSARAHGTREASAAATRTLFALPSTLSTAAGASVVVIGLLQLQRGEVSLGTLVAFQLLVGSFLLPVTSAVGLGRDTAVARALLGVVRDVLEAEPDPYVTPLVDGPAGPAPRLRGGVEVDAVTFGYDPARPPVLSGVSLRLQPGERVAVVGTTGSGKSTLARVVTGVLRPWSGEVRYDGIRREDVPRAVLCSSVGYVEQQFRLFAGSVRDNVTLWDPTMPDEQVWQALADAAVTDVVRIRGGLDTPWVQEEARNLSGGERQRLELARALALDPAVLVLDEATSALDPATEALVTEQLRRRGCSCLVLAHRLSTVRDADQILVLDGGRVVQRGRHEELLAEPGVYRRLVEDLA